MSVHNKYTGYLFEAFIAEAYVQLAATDSTVFCSMHSLFKSICRSGANPEKVLHIC